MKSLNNLLYNFRNFGLTGVSCAVRSKLQKRPVYMKVKSELALFPFYLRYKTTDVQTFDKIFGELEYEIPEKLYPAVIVDAGANIGLASIYFASRYRNSRVYAIEPEAANFAMLLKNVAPYRNIIPIRAALWNRDEEIFIKDPGEGHWSFMTIREATDGQNVPGVNLDTLMRMCSIDRIDLLKVDVEGAEEEIFGNAAQWIGRVGTIVIELHERLRPGSSQSFNSAIEPFCYRYQRGENLFCFRERPAG